MTTQELIQQADQHPFVLVGAFAGLPLLSFLFGHTHREGQGGLAPWKYVYSLLVYLACIPGLFSAVLTGYTMFFTGESLLKVSVLVYLLPLVSMVVTLVLVRRRVDFDAVPGFDRLSGLMVMLGCSFAIALAIDKTRILVGFFGSFERLLLLAAGVFALLKWGAHALFRRRDDSARAMPRFPPHS